MFAQEQKTFETEYARIMAEVKKWEAIPENVIKVVHRNYHGGRRIYIKTIFSTKKDTAHLFVYKRIQKIKYTKSGIARERVKIYDKGFRLGSLKKLNDKWN